MHPADEQEMESMRDDIDNLKHDKEELQTRIDDMEAEIEKLTEVLRDVEHLINPHT